MTGFLAELGSKLAERWVALLVLPGLLFTAVAATAVVLGQRNWSDTAELRRRLADAVAAGGGQDGVLRTAVLLVLLLLASVGSGLVAQALGRPTEYALVGRWPPVVRRLARVLTERRKAAWTALDGEYTVALNSGDQDRLGPLAMARNRIALAPPACATWTGDRMRAPALRVRNEYGLDLASAWPRLWLLLPDSTREPLAESRRRFDEATVLGGWSVLYLLVAIAWWPAALVAVCLALVAWRRARATADVYAELVEATVDVHLTDLLDRFADGARPVRPQQGKAVSERFRKGT